MKDIKNYESSVKLKFVNGPKNGRHYLLDYINYYIFVDNFLDISLLDDSFESDTILADINCFLYDNLSFHDCCKEELKLEVYFNDKLLMSTEILEVYLSNINYSVLACSLLEQIITSIRNYNKLEILLDKKKELFNDIKCT